MESNKNLSNLDIKVLSDIFHHLNEINQSCNLLRESFLNSTDIVDKINRSISFLNQFEDIFIYIDKERSLTKYQKKVYRNLTIMIKHIQVSNLTQEKLQKLILEYRDIIESSSDFLNQKIKLEKIIEH
ncbi:hypothetical protein [uncultured Prochlorococcus sp.]|jgi:hypothetical protein|uniref:hypothetical protein n=1 Tax=uncultured Prochlorococcus sp. TaxID=159733 RepID=UPI00258F29B7|nr:hypothetical protein [uncultured Prochlorococcus sp.]|tara:strand:- start:272 stop:655 length:384 start_codon:yes stop_codon:yes gene_type:complete